MYTRDNVMYTELLASKTKIQEQREHVQEHLLTVNSNSRVR